MENRASDFFKGRIGQAILESTLLQFGYKVERIGCELSPVVEKEDTVWPDLLPDLKITAPEGGKPVYLDQLAAHGRMLGPGHTYCALAPGAMEPLQSALKYFREDFEQHIFEKRCPWNGK